MSKTFTNKQVFGRRLHEEGNSEGAVKGWKTRKGLGGVGSQGGRDIIAHRAKDGRVKVAQTAREQGLTGSAKRIANSFARENTLDKARFACIEPKP
jgi:hypothetical protein